MTPSHRENETTQPDGNPRTLSTQRLTQSGQAVETSMIATVLLDEAGQIYGIATTKRVLPT